MTERPILFSAPMMRAILAGQKTQTRRVVKPQPGWITLNTKGLTAGRLAEGVPSVIVWSQPESEGSPSKQIACPYGQPGDRLWVRETWAPNEGSHGGFLYRADHNDASGFHKCDLKTGVWTHSVSRWKPSIHMPRTVSRITLNVTGVRVERLQDISEADALAEGIVPQHGGGFGLPAGEHYHALDPRISYWSLWDAINGAGSVEANPWVWVVSFERVST